MTRYRRRNHRIRHLIIITCLIIILIALVGATAYFTVLTKPGSEAASTSLPGESTVVSSEQSSVSTAPASSALVSTSPESSAQASSAPVSSATVSSTPVSSATVPVTPPPVAPGAPAYQSLYPELFVPVVEKIPAASGANVVYLTFDDGPSPQTTKVLDILDRYKIKATFFLIGNSDAASKKIMKEIVDRGHAIAIHTYSHDYKKIYASPEAFLKDFKQMRDLIVDATGVEPTMFRFAGGSVNSYNKTTAKAIIDEMTRRGYTYYDWNASAGDAEKGATETSIYNDSINGTLGNNKTILLFHDAAAKTMTINQLPKIIEKLQKNGYNFDKLDPSVKPIIFPVPKK